MHLTIESIAQGELRPSRVILWLDEPAKIHALTASLRRLQRRGLEIRPCKNYRSHKKYYPYVEAEEMITRPLATADDDVLYPTYWLKKLTDAFQEFPNCVNCYRAREIQMKDGEPMPYKNWKECTGTMPSFKHFATGVSGVMYSPPLLMDLKAAGTRFEECCPRADDLWLHARALRSGFRVRQIYPRARHFPLIPGSQKASLYDLNVVNSDGNDLQLKSTYTEADFAIILADHAEVTTAVANLKESPGTDN